MSWFEDPGFTSFESYNLSALNVDEAWLKLSSISQALWLYSVSDNCYQCSLERKSMTPILPGEPQVLQIDTQYPSIFRLRTDGSARWASLKESKSNFLCEIHFSPGEFGVYELSVSNKSEDLCTIVTKLEPVNVYLPLVGSIIFLVTFAVLFNLYKRFGLRLYNWFKTTIFQHTTSSSRRSSGSSTLIQSSNQELSPSSSRESQRSQLSESVGGKKKKRKSKTVTAETISTQNESTIEDLFLEDEQTVEEQISLPLPNIDSRFQSIDTFRGIAIMIMILADDGGGMYFFLDHATWNGLYVADLAFPWFLWIMGICIPISIRSQRNKGSDKRKILKKIIIRSIKLILLGIFLNTSSTLKPISFGNLRLPGVLQRFGVCYLIASALFLYLCEEPLNVHRSDHRDLSVSEHVSLLKDFSISWIPWIIMILGVTLHTLLVFLLPVPGCPMGYLGPGGIHLDRKYGPHCIGGATGYIDKILFSKEHLYQRPTPKKVYHTGPFDPEGAFGVLPSLFHTWIGVSGGIILLTFTKPWSRIKRFLVWAFTCGLMGFGLCGGFKNDGWIPLNKNLWSLSFVLVTCSFAWTLLAVLYYTIDVRKYWSGSPLFECGKNSILLYVGHNVARAMLPWNYSFGRMNTHTSHLIENAWGILLWIILAVYLDKKKLYLVV